MAAFSRFVIVLDNRTLAIVLLLNLLFKDVMIRWPSCLFFPSH